MYNPINMKVEDPQRLVEKDIRDKNKKKRYEARVANENQTREEGLAEQDRLDEMALRRISHKHTEEQVTRGFNILTNGLLDKGLQIIKDQKQEYLKPPTQTWSKINSGAQSVEQSKPQSRQAMQTQPDLGRTQFGQRDTRVSNLL